MSMATPSLAYVPPVLQPQRKTVQLKGESFSLLAWEDAPKDVPVLHFAHANGFNGNTYRQLLAPLAQHMRIYAWDARGHGLTTANADPDELQNWQCYRDDLEALVEHLGAPVILAGHSLGGVISSMVAAHRPDLVQGLVLADPVFFSPLFIRLWRIWKTLGQGERFHLPIAAKKRRYHWPDRQSIIDSYTGRSIFTHWQNGYVADYINGGTLDAKDGGVHLACHPLWEARTFATSPFDTWGFVPRVRCPVTVVYGADSDTFKDSAARKLQRSLPNATLRRVSGTGHFVPMEDPEPLRAELLRMAGLIQK